MIRKIFAAFIAVLICFIAGAQDLSLFKAGVFVQKSDTLLYRYLLPENYDASKKYPLVIFLHGAGEKGNDNETQLIHGANVFLRDDVRSNYPAIVIFPQCPENQSWANYRFDKDSTGKRIFELRPDEPPTRPLEMVEELISHLKKQYPVDKKRIYVGGLSMGGMGTFEIARRNPKLFAAAFPICGATDARIAKKIKNISWWIFHGAKDDVVPPTSSMQIADALKNEKADVRFTLYPEANHNSWDPAFAEKDLFPWLFSKKK
jgi:predicted peptidase